MLGLCPKGNTAKDWRSSKRGGVTKGEWALVHLALPLLSRRIMLTLECAASHQQG